MNGTAILILLAAILLPCLWFVSEFQEKRSVRLTFGVAAISLSFALAFVVGSLERYNANAWFGGASQKLIDTMVEELNTGNQEKVTQALKWLQANYQPTY